LQILSTTPEAAQTRNSFGITCLHLITQGSVNFDSETKETLIFALIHAYPDALIVAGGIGKRTPLHNIFTGGCSCTYKLTSFLIRKRKQATFKEDDNKWLPIHVACSYHVCPNVLKLLIVANPDSIHVTTSSGDTALSLAVSTATRHVIDRDRILVSKFLQCPCLTATSALNPRVGKSQIHC